MKLRLKCDGCGKEGDDVSEYGYDGTDLCKECARKEELRGLKYQRDQLKAWLESTHLKKLSELEAEIKELEKP